jgi:hypothetical protein
VSPPLEISPSRRGPAVVRERDVTTYDDGEARRSPDNSSQHAGSGARERKLDGTYLYGP